MPPSHVRRVGWAALLCDEDFDADETIRASPARGVIAAGHPPFGHL
jgi:hypothetical protein